MTDHYLNGAFFWHVARLKASLHR